jgi:DNA-directed RNA polymerase subunit E'/Rpb7
MANIEGGFKSKTGTTTTSGIIQEDKLFVHSLLSHRVILKPTEITASIKDVLVNKIKKAVEKKCIKDGYVLPDSVVLEEYSFPKIDRGHIIYYTMYSCKICYPVEGMILECTCDVKSRAGIHAMYEYITENNEIIQPIEIFVYRDHNLEDSTFNRIKEKDKIKICIIGTRIELGSPTISVIAKLVL